MNKIGDVKGVLGWLAISSVAVLVSACGTSPKPVTNVNTIVEGSSPEQGLPATARIVADGRPAELTGFTFSAEEREAFQYERAKRERDAAHSNHPVSRGLADPRLILVPITWPFVIVALPAAYITESAIASAKVKSEPSLLSEKECARLAAVVRKHATSTSLAQRTASLVSAPEGEYPRLEVRLKSALLEHGHVRYLTLIATAQAYLSADVEWPPTEHRYALAVQPGELTDQAIAATLDAFAASIVAAYMPSHRLGVERAVWNKARNDDSLADMQSYLEAYPDGRFARAARERIAYLSGDPIRPARYNRRQARIERRASIREACRQELAGQGPFPSRGPVRCRLTEPARSSD